MLDNGELKRCSSEFECLNPINIDGFLPFSEFHVSSSTKGGDKTYYRKECKVCRSERRKTKYSKK